MPWQPMQSSKEVSAVTCTRDHIPKDQEQLRSDLHLYQTWRSPSWLYYSNNGINGKNHEESEVLACFSAVIDVTLRLAWTVLVLAGLGYLHCIHEKANQVILESVENVSTHLQANVSVGRLVRCNPFSGIRVNNVLVSKSARNGHIPFGRAAYVHASFSGYTGFALHKRPIELKVSVHRGVFTISCIRSPQYVAGNVYLPNFEELIWSLERRWRKLSGGTLLSKSKLFEVGSIALSKSRLHVESNRQNLAGNSVHSIDVVNMSACLELSKCPREVSTLPSHAKPSRDVITFKGNFPGGGYAHICLTVQRSQGKSPKSDISSLSASAKCSKVNVGSIASFFSLPFRLRDGLCTGSVDIELSPLVSLVPSMNGQVELKSLGVQFDPSPQSPDLRNVTGKLRFQRSSVMLERMEGDLGSIPLEAKGHIDLVEGFNIEGHAKPFDVNRIIETFALDRFIPVQGSVIGKAVVQGHLGEPSVSGWIKAVGNRVIADRVPLKSAVMTYDWDVPAGNLIFPTIQASVAGGGEITGNGGIYFDMTQATPGGFCKEKHHVRNPKAAFWNPDINSRKTLPPRPTDDLEIDRWASCRPYDSMDFMITSCGVPGKNLVRWYDQRLSNIMLDPMSHIGGFCRITGNVEDANSQVVWRSTRLSSLASFKGGNMSSTSPLNDNDVKVKIVPVASQRFLDQFDTLDTGCSVSPFNDYLSREFSTQQEDSEFLGGFVQMKLGDVPEARRVKARTTIKGFRINRLLSTRSCFRDVLSGAPEIVMSMDTLFKGTICMRPSWDNARFKDSTLNTHLDLTSVDGGLAVRKLSVNGVAFRNTLSGSLSVSATDISLNLSESQTHRLSSSLLTGDCKSDEAFRSEHAPDVLEIELNSKGLFRAHLKWKSSEVCASMYLNEERHRVARLSATNVSLQQLSGECNPLFEGESVQGILTMSCELDVTDQVGSAKLTATNFSFGLVCFESVKSQFSLNNRELRMNGAVLQLGHSRLDLDGRLRVLEDFSDFEWCLDFHIDDAHVHDLSILLQNVVLILTSQSEGFLFGNETGDNLKTKLALPDSQCDAGRSNVTYWEVPCGLTFTEQTRWFNQSNEGVNDDFSALFGFGPTRTHLSSGTIDSCNKLSGTVAIHFSSQHNRGAQRSSKGRLEWGPLSALASVTLSFNLTGQNLIIGSSTFEQVAVRGFLEDGSLSLEPSEVKGADGLQLKCEGSVTSTGSLDGSVSLHHVPVSSLSFFRKAGLRAVGNVDGMFRIKGSVFNPKIYGRMLWNRAVVNGRRFISHPHADLSCSNGRCVINVEAAIGGVEKRRKMSANTEDPISAEVVRVTLQDETAPRENQKTTMQDTRPKPSQDVDTVTARMSIPVRLLVHQCALSRLSEALMGKEYDSIDVQTSFDEDWVFASIEIRRYGMALLNAFIPKLGWIEGNSDVMFRLAGTQRDPDVTGYVKLKDGSVRPSWFTHPINCLNGEIEVRDFGLLTCKHLSGRCNGRGVSLHGGLFVSKRHKDRFEEKRKKLQELLSASESDRMMPNQELQDSLNKAVSALRKGRDGIRVDIGAIPTRFGDVCEGTISGKVLLTGTFVSPNIEGSLLFSEGVINAGNAFADTSRSAKASSQLFASNVFVNSSLREPLVVSQKAAGSRAARMKSDRTTQLAFADYPCNVHLRHLTLRLGRNVRIVHSFLFNVLAGGSISLSGQSTNPTLFGKINILSGSVSALPSRWAFRKSESSYVSFTREANRLGQEPTVKLSLENDTIILRIAECTASKWMDNLSLSHKAGNRVPDKWWADAIHLQDDEKSTQKIVSLLTGLVINTLAVGGDMGEYDWKLFPTHYGDALQKSPEQPHNKIGAGFQLGQGSHCFESNVFIDKLRGAQFMVKLARVVSLHLFGDHSRRFANIEIRLPKLES